MKKIYFVVLLILTISFLNKNHLSKAEEVKKEVKTEQKPEVKAGSEDTELLFRVKKVALWLRKAKEYEDKNPGDIIETSLIGKLYDSPVNVPDIIRKNVDRSTIEGAVASIFSANKKGDAEWIADNFIDGEKERVKSLFSNKDLLEEAQTSAKKIKNVYIVGQANYKDYVLAFIEQVYIDGNKVKESLACKETLEGWKLTNSLTADKTFDIVFSALTYGEVLPKREKISKEELRRIP